jgi:DME family drug/metabolite transporter
MDQVTAVTTTTHRVPLMASLLAFGAGVVWSLGSLTARLAGHTDAWQYMIWRSIGVLCVMEIVSRVRGQGWMTPKAFNQGRIMLIATFGLMLASLAFVYAIKNTTSANAAFLASATPLFAVALSRVFLGERMSRVTIGALLLALCGLAIMVATDLGAGNMAGNISALASSLGFAIYSVCVRSEPNRDWAPILPGYASLMIVLCVVVTLAKGNSVVPPAADTGWALLHGGILIVVGTIMFNVGSRTVPAVPMTIMAQSEMAFVPIWIYLQFGEVPTHWALVGGAIILTAVIGKAVLDARPASSGSDQRQLLAHIHENVLETPETGPGFIA